MIDTNKLPENYSLRVFETGSAWTGGMTYGCKLYLTVNRIIRCVGSSTRTASESSAIYNAIKSASYRHSELKEMVKEYEDGI